MKHRDIKSCSLASYVLIGFLLVINVTGGGVLCFGSDGHIDLEIAYHARCFHSDETSGIHETFKKQLHTGPKHCEPCVDIPFLLGNIHIPQVSQRNHIVSKLPEAIFPANQAAHAVLLEIDSIQLSDIKVNPTLTSLRAVILLN